MSLYPRCLAALSRAYAVMLCGTLLLAGNGCVATMYVHRTLEGQYFPSERLGEMHQGLTAEEVVQVLGEPLAREEDGASAKWRYFERAQPRWCDGGNPHQARPEYRVEALLYFRDRVLQSSHVVRHGTSSERAAEQ